MGECYSPVRGGLLIIVKGLRRGEKNLDCDESGEGKGGDCEKKRKATTCRIVRYL